MELQNSNSWYEKKWLVIVLCIVFFPIGLYALWKNTSISKGWKIGVTVFFAFGIIANLGNSDTKLTSEFDLKEEKKERLWKIAYDSETYLKQNLKDPSSYEQISKDYSFLNDSVYSIKIVFSGTNSFGGRIQNTYVKTGILSFIKKDTTFVNTVKYENTY